MENASKQYEGEWWHPARPDRKLGGILELGDSFELRLWGSLDERTVPSVMNGAFDANILNGVSLSKALTIIGGRFRGSQYSSTGSSIIQVRAPLVFAGSYLLESADEATFTKVDASPGNLLQWIARSGLSREWPNRGHAKLEYTALEPSIASTQGATLELHHGFVANGDDHWAEWQEAGSLLFELSEPHTVPDIEYKFLRPFRYFLDLATGSAPHPGPLQVANPDHLEEPTTQWLDVHAYGRDKRVPRKKPPMVHEMLFSLPEIEFAEVVPRWYALVDKLGITCDLLFSLSAPQNVFAGNKLFNVASAAEGIHQRLYPEADRQTPEHRQRVKEILDTTPEDHRDWLKAKLAFSHAPTFADRLQQLIDHAGSCIDPFIGDRDKWVRLVKDVRNQIAHARRERHIVETEVVKQVRLTATIDVLLRVILLRELGFTDDQCVNMVQRNPQWSYLQSVLPTALPEIF
ncbi:HEPN domain-containing protein [Amycolatopsis thermoflava]|uniref:HEPN domain-containing protein n=1 Tax=Amycolatopsis thermoflava TaxID=84480 RepID=UPI0012FAEB0B|nr:HEPN domain-containing protein [Amycolatopsis thermoflava]